MQMHEHESELGRWRMAQRKAHPDLRAFVKGYLTSSSVLPTPVRERHLPSTEVPLLINLGAPHRHLNAAQPDKWTNRDGAWIVGLQNSRLLTEASGERDFLVVRFTPIGAHLFLRTPMHALAGQVADLSAIDPALASAVLDRVGGAKTWSDRFERIEELIANRIAQTTVPIGISQAWYRLEASYGHLSLTHLASLVDCSHRTLIAKFRTCIGQTPKATARLLRFNRAIRSLNELVRDGGSELAGKPFIESDERRNRSETVSWADIAVDCGYFDQSHFIKEFSHFAGTTPSDFVARVLNVA